ncbi:MAG TPA: HD domain-containing protein [Bacillota bacterium]|jgi:predicted hydrolase (HD superfamily)|nr:HD domain-containing protein [Fastidiosipila sp.]HPX92809.1 HD domain-containing protein [Bacillota bacterium]HQB81294.1 HD domain-containing protein [Bacillota bacterium]
MRTSQITREKALELLKKYNKETFHLEHALTVEAVMAWLAEKRGYGEEKEYWAITGLLHDIDFEKYPDKHLEHTPRILEEAGVGEDMIRSIVSHGYGICSDVEPLHEMEKILYAMDELSGLIGAAALVRPSKSVSDMQVSSVKKKFKSKGFAAGCDRETIQKGADALGWTLDELIARTLEAMQASEDEIRRELEAI